MSKALESQLGQIHLLADAEYDRFRVVVAGSDNDHAKYPTAVTDVPLGILPEGCEAAEDAIPVRLCGYGETPILKMAGTGSKGDNICPSVDGTGTGRAIPTTGMVYAFARANEDWAADQEISVTTFLPMVVNGKSLTEIVVAKNGDDTLGDGSDAKPFLTITKAMTLWTALRPTIVVKPGEYAEAATLTWPNITGLTLMGLAKDTVVISNADAAAQVLLIAPTFTASTFGASIKNIGIAADTQIGINVLNANMTKKLNVYLDGVTAEMDTSGDSLNAAGTVSGQAIRLYVKNCEFEGLVHAVMNDAGSRLRCELCTLTGGFTVAGNVAAEASFFACRILTSGETITDAAWRVTYAACVNFTDADPTVHTAVVDAAEG